MRLIYTFCFLFIVNFFSLGQCWKSLESEFDTLAIRYAIQSNGSLWQLSPNSLPIQLGFDRSWKKCYSTFNSCTFLISEDSTMWGFGNNGNGELGIGNTNYQPTLIQLNNERWLDMSEHQGQTLAVRSDGTLWYWGFWCSPCYFTLLPSQIGTDNNWVEVHVNGNQIIALKNDGTIWNGNYNGSFTFTQIGTDSNWKYIWTNDFSWIGIKNDGTLWQNNVQAGNDTDWKKVIGNMPLLGIKNNGSLWYWETDLIGSIPVQLNQNVSFKDISGIYYTSAWDDYIYGITTSGELYRGPAILNSTSDLSNDTLANSLLTTLTVNSETICSGEFATLTAIPFISGGNYLWSPGGDTTESITINPLNSITYSISYTLGDCQSNEIATVIVNPNPVVSAGLDINLCLGDSVLLSATGSESYYWNTGETSSFIMVTPSSTTTYTVQATNIYNCTASDDVTVNIATPVTGTDNITSCSPITWIDGNVYTSNNNIATFNILGGSAAGCDSMVTLNLTISPAASGTDNIISCTPITWIDGNVYTSNNNTASFNILGGSATGCDSLVTLNLTISPAASGTDNIISCTPITWIDGNFYDSTNNTATFNIAGGAANGCDSLVTLNLTILPSATLSLNSQTICSGLSSILTAIPSLLGGTYLWSPGGETTESIIINPTITTSYTVSYTLGDCQTTEISTVTVHPNPIISAGVDVNLCFGDSVMLSAIGAHTYFWDNGIGVGNDFFVSPSSLTSYSVLGTDSLGCSATDTIIVNPSQFIPPTLATFPSEPSLCNGTGLVTLDPTGNFSVYWGNGAEGENGYDLCPGLTVVYVIENNFGCQYSEYAFVEETGSSYPLSIHLSVQDVSYDGNCDGSAQFFGFGGIPPYSFELLDAANVIVSTQDWANMLCSGYYNVRIIDAMGDIDSLPFYVADPSYIFSFNPFPDSIIIDTLHTDIYEDCNIDFETVDSAWVSHINYINADTAIITWAIQDMNGIQYIDQSYNVTNLQGSFTVELTVFCPGKALGDPYFKIYTTIYFNNDFNMSIYDLNDDNLISIYPNPTIDYVQIKSENKRIEIIRLYDSFGKEVLLTNEFSGNEKTIKIPKENGVYVLAIIFKDGSITSKRIVKTTKG